jgi:hypothetical protein
MSTRRETFRRCRERRGWEVGGGRLRSCITARSWRSLICAPAVAQSGSCFLKERRALIFIRLSARELPAVGPGTPFYRERECACSSLDAAAPIGA